MGRVVVERCVTAPVDEGLCRVNQQVVRENYLFALDEIAAFTLGRTTPAGEYTLPTHLD